MTIVARGRATLLLVVLVALAVPVGRGRAASQDSPGEIAFSAGNMVATAEGTFRSWRFTRLTGDRDHPEDGVVELEVDIASIDTGNERRDAHLRTDDFFDIDRFPTAHVKLYGLRRAGESSEGHPQYRVTLDVRIRDVVRTMETAFVLVGTSPPKVQGTLVLNRVDFGVGGAYRRWNPLSVREAVEIRFRAALPSS